MFLLLSPGVTGTELAQLHPTTCSCLLHPALGNPLLLHFCQIEYTWALGEKQRQENPSFQGSKLMPLQPTPRARQHRPPAL